MTAPVRNAFVFGITGGIACGKSEVGRILEGMGFAVCDADVVAHGLMRKGTRVFDQVVAHFGAGIVSESGEISRPALGKAVFGNPAQREALNRLVHPAVRKELAEWIGDRRRLGEHAAVMIPLLFESGMQDLGFDAVLCVSSHEALVMERLERRGLAHAEAGQRIQSQMPLAEKEQRADLVIWNDGTLDDLEKATREAVARLGV